MNWKTTVTLLGVVIVLGLWVWLGESQVGTSDDRIRTEKMVLPHLKLEQVVGLEVRRGEDPAILITRSDGPVDPMLGPKGWRLEQPLTDEADDPVVNQLLNQLQFLQWVEHIPAERAGNIQFGETQLAVSIRRSDGREGYAFQVGEARPSGVTPLRVEGSDDVYLVKSIIHDHFPEQVWAYRRKVLFNAPRPEITGLSIERPALSESPGAERETIALARRDGFWRLEAGEGDFAAPALVKDLLDTVLGLRAVASENDSPTPDDLARYGLAPTPWVTLSVDLPEELPGVAPDLARHQAVQLGAPVPDHDGHRYARYGDRPYVYRLAMGELEKELTQRASGEFHNPALFPVRGGAETVTGYGAWFSEDDTWRLQKRGPSWVFEGENEVKASPNPALELARALVELEVERVVGAKDEVELAKLGLDEPQLKLELVEETLRREAHVGDKVSGRPGHFYVLRLDDGRVFEADLGMLPQRLEAAPLELLDRRILRASSFDSKRIAITRPDGTAALDVTRVPAQEGQLEHWRVDAPPALQADADSDRIQRFADLFDQVNVDRYVAHDGPEARQRYGLESPTRIAITVSVYGEDSELTDEVRELLIGRREKAFVYALNPKQGVVGRIDATFLDVLERGFAKGTAILELDRWSVTEMVVYERGAEVLRLTKNGDNWKRDNLELAEGKPIEKLLSAFERIEVTRAELANPEAKRARGLAEPRARIAFEVTPLDGGEPQQLELHLGDPLENGYEVWATSVRNGQAHDRLGSLFHEPLLILRKYKQDFPAPNAFPPVQPQDGEEQNR